MMNTSVIAVNPEDRNAHRRAKRWTLTRRAKTKIKTYKRRITSICGVNYL
jgi:hypothetical protein